MEKIILNFFGLNIPKKINYNVDYVYRGKTPNDEIIFAKYYGSRQDMLGSNIMIKIKGPSTGKDKKYLNPGIDITGLVKGNVYSFRREEGKICITHLVQSVFASLAGLNCPVTA